MKAQATYNGLTLEWYTMGANNEYVTFHIQGTDIYENYYDVTVEAQKHNNFLNVEPVDAEGYEYDEMVERVIINLAPHNNLVF